MLLDRRQTLEALEEKAAPVHELRRDTSRLERQLAILSERESLLHTLEKAGHPLTILAIVSQSAAVNTGRLRITDLALETTVRGPRTGENASAKQSDRTRSVVDLRLSGLCSDNLSVARFVDVIRSFDVFDEVSLGSTDDGSNNSQHDFQLTCQYEE